MSPGLHEPLPSDLRRALRSAVLDLRTRLRSRRFAPELTVGRPGGPSAALSLATTELLDHGLCTEIVGSLMHRVLPQCAEPMCWLARPGLPTLHDLDVAWLSAALSAGGERGLRPVVVVLTRTGWFDPRSGTGQTWRRLRQR